MWWHDWATGESGAWTAKVQSKLTASEKAELAKRMDDARKAREAEQAAAIAETAKRAQGIYTIATECIEHPYLTRKGVAACHGLRLHKGALVVPAYGDGDKVATLQFIPREPGDNGKWPKKYLRGQKAKGCLFPIGGKKKDKPLVICEGLATGLSLYEYIGLPVLAAFDAENLLPVAVMARARYPEREIILAADNDTETDGNPGVTKATAAARAIGGSLAVPRLDGQAVDWNDLHKKRGAGEVRTQFMMHRPPAEDSAKEGNNPAQNEDALPAGFFLRSSGNLPGLWHVEPKEDGDPVETWIGAPLHVLGATRDENSNAWGLLLQWHDQDNQLHTWAMPKALLVGKDSSAWLGRLVNEGWGAAAGQRARNLLALFLAAYRTEHRARCVDRTGWYQDSFVFPDTVFRLDKSDKSDNAIISICCSCPTCKNKVGQVRQVGQDAERIVLQVQTAHNPFRLGGTPDG